jgi:hypothetical protein
MALLFQWFTNLQKFRDTAGLLRARTYPPICYVYIQIYRIGDIPMLYATHMYYAPC